MLFNSYTTPFPSHEDDLEPSLLLESIHSRVVDFFPQPPLTGGTRAGCVAWLIVIKMDLGPCY